MPVICQECFLCSDHHLLFQKSACTVDTQERFQLYDQASAEVSGTPSLTSLKIPAHTSSYGGSFLIGPLPLTEDEWGNILSAFKIACGDEFELPTEVRTDEGLQQFNW